VLAEENVQDIQSQLEVSPCKSSRCLAQEIGVSLKSIHSHETLNFTPYKITVVHELEVVPVLNAALGHE
jgi:hypothetical protein